MAADSCAGVLVEQANNRKLAPNDRRAAAIAVLDRAGLKPTDNIQLSGPDGGAIPFVDITNLSDEQLAAVKAAQVALKAGRNHEVSESTPL